MFCCHGWWSSMWYERNRYVKIFDGMVRKLKEVRYIPQLKMNLISIGALKAFDLEESIRDVFSRWLEAQGLFWRASDATNFITWMVVRLQGSGDFYKFRWWLHLAFAYEAQTLIGLYIFIFHTTSSHLFHINFCKIIAFLCVSKSIVWNEEEDQKSHLFSDF